MKRPRWDCRFPRREYSYLDPAVVEAARRARACGWSDLDNTVYREAALAQLPRRRAKLVREVEMIEMTIASMKGN
jgi:hypothetical protein